MKFPSQNKKCNTKLFLKLMMQSRHVWTLSFDCDNIYEKIWTFEKNIDCLKKHARGGMQYRGFRKNHSILVFFVNPPHKNMTILQNAIDLHQILIFLHETYGNRKLTSKAIRFQCVFIKYNYVFIIIMAKYICGTEKKAHIYTILAFLENVFFWGSPPVESMKKIKKYFFSQNRRESKYMIDIRRLTLELSKIITFVKVLEFLSSGSYFFTI